MKCVCLLAVLLLATVGPASVTGQDRPTFIGENESRLLTLERDPSEVAGKELSTGNELLARCEQALGEQPGPRDASAASVCRSVVRGVFDMTGLTRDLQVCSLWLLNSQLLGILPAFRASRDAIHLPHAAFADLGGDVEMAEAGADG